MVIKKRSKKGLRIKKVIWQRKKCYYINPIVRLWLVFLGKRDSKKSKHNIVVFPFVDLEKSKIDKYVSKISYSLGRKTMSLFANFDNRITMLEQQLFIVNDLIKRLENKTYPEEIVISDNDDLPDKIMKMLKVKRISENDLEETAIKIRRFKEYHKNLASVKAELFNEMQKLLAIYQDLCFYSANIEGIYVQANMIIRQYISYINIRVSLYRRGWIKNDIHQKNMPELIDPDSFLLSSQNRTLNIDDKIKKITDSYEKIMNP